MREFFVKCFHDLQALTGLKQYTDLASHPDKEWAQDVFNKIVNGMIHQSAMFEKLVPYERQKEVIEQGIISDPEMYALNAKMVYKWLHDEFKRSQARGIESGHHETNQLLESLPEPAPISEQTQKMINKYMFDLSRGISKVPEVSQKEIDDLKIEDLEQREGKKPVSAGVKYSTQEDYILQQKKIEWARECTELHTGKLKPRALSFDEFIRLDKQPNT